MKHAFVRLVLLAGAVTLAARPLSAQTASDGLDLTQILATQSPGTPAVVQYNNRSIATLRATILSRSPAERADAIHRLLDHAMSDGRPGPVSSREIQGVNVILVGDRQAFAILPLDVDTLAGETAAERRPKPYAIYNWRWMKRSRCAHRRRS